jgi:hypothetical protein
MSFKLTFLLCSLAALSRGHETGTDKINVSQACKNAMDKALHPNSTECNFGKSADLSVACPKLDSCLDTQRNIIKNECSKEENDNAEVKQVVEFQVAIDMRSRCLKDTAGNWCKRLNSTSDAKVCQECEMKMVEMIKMVTATASEQAKEKFMSAKSTPCKPKSNSTSSEHGAGHSTGSGGQPSGNKDSKVVSAASSMALGGIALIAVTLATFLPEL